MRIVIATPLYPPDIGGPATYAKLLADGLPDRGITVDLVKFSEVRHLPKIVRHLVYFLNIRRALRHADVVLALDPVSVGWPASIAARFAKKPFVVKIVGDYAWEQGRQRSGITDTLDQFVKTKRVPFFVRILRRIQSRVARRAARIIVPSEYLKGIVASWGIPTTKIEVVYNAAVLEQMGAIPKEAEVLPLPLIVTAGRLVPWKNIDGVISAVSQIRAEGSPASLIVVGEGPLKESLSVQAEKLGMACIFTGALSHADTLAVLKSADVFVLNSSYEGLSHLLIEALMLGVPIIATRVGGNPEVVTDGESGLLIPSGDHGALVESLKRILGDSDLRMHLTMGAQKSSERFSVEAMLTHTHRILASV